MKQIYNTDTNICTNSEGIIYIFYYQNPFHLANIENIIVAVTKI